ncbi:hypothetical protein [Acetivibrio cellulolyticus]|uniref:hypothetical protein n=1 Tax=Acetivibrio cellulolyticus TaxID=35830 RepID=UPI0001E2DE80|nr:hypothetical protein [Acetivibrio cellulolyticus]
MSNVLLATVVSEPQPQSGQSHRSSGNFSTDSMPDGTKYFLFKVINHPNPDPIRFDVMQDKSAAKDPTWYKDVYNNKQEDTHIDKCRNLYIANPENADSKQFTVEVYAVI